MSGALVQTISNNLQTIAAVPAELRQIDATLVAETTIGDLLSGQVKVAEPGKYLASVRLPTGFQLTLPLDIEADGSLRGDALTEVVQRSLSSLLRAVPTVTTAAFLPLASSALAALQQHAPAMAAFFGSLIGSRITTEASAETQSMGFAGAPDLGGWKLRAWVGTPLHGDLTSLQPATLAASLIDGGLRVVTDETADRPLTVHLTSPEGEAFNYIVPPGTSITAAADGTASFDVGEPTMNGILRRRAAGEIVSTILVNSIDEDFVRKCRDHPGAALTAAYAVLSRSQNRSQNVAALEALNDPAVRSDMLVLRGELEARRGRHTDALRFFLEAGGLDLPTFTSGLGYLVDRLRFYVRLGESDREISGLLPNGLRNASNALAAVQPYAIGGDITAPFITYRGAALRAAALDEESSQPAMQLGG